MLLEEADVPALIEALHRKSSVEYRVLSDKGPTRRDREKTTEAISRDPHLRLRRTLTPSVGACGRPGVEQAEAQYLIEGSTGERRSMGPFSWKGETFIMDGYFWGSSEATARHRIVALHGVTPGVSRTRWHALGEKLTRENPSIRFCAVDWHSIDRTDKPQDAFLTMLPKHFGGFLDSAGIGEGRHAEVEALLAKAPTTEELQSLGMKGITQAQVQARMRALLQKVEDAVPRTHHAG